MNQKKDRRVQYTKMVLRESLLDLLKTKRLNDISISALCKTADINRNTFYNHYASPHEILNEVETELYDELMHAIHHTANLQEIILVACKSLEQNKKLSKLIFTQTETSHILSKVLSSVKNNPGLGEITNVQQQPLTTYVYTFSEKGAVAVIQHWVRNGFKEPAEVIAHIITFLVNGINQSAKALS